VSRGARRLLPALLVVASVLVASSADAQTAASFQRQYDHPERWFFPYAQVQASDGGYVICGDSYHVGTQDSSAYLMKLDPIGDVVWTKEYRLLAGFQHAASIVRVDGPAGDVYVVLVDVDQVQRPALMAVDVNGQFLGSKGYFDAAGSQLTMHELQRTSDGGWMMLGKTFDPGTGLDALAMKLDAIGTPQWTRRLAGSIPFPLFGSDDDALGMLEVRGGTGYIVSAMVGSDAYLGLWSGAGVPLFALAYKIESAFLFERVLGLFLTSTNRIVLVANADLSNDRFPLIIELDPTGAIVGTQAVSLPMSATRAIGTSDGGFVIAGSSLIVPGAQGLRLVKYDANLNQQWSWQYDATLTFATINPPANVIETADGGFLVTVAARDGTDPVQHVVKVAADGTTACNPDPIGPEFVFDVEVVSPTTTSDSTTINDFALPFTETLLPVDASDDCAGSGAD